MKKNRSFGFWVLIIIGALLTIEYLLGQTMALINYEWTVSIGLQEPESELTAIGVALNKAFGLGDTVVYIPLFIVGIFGLLKNKEWACYAMFGALAITVYWPIVAMFTLIFAKGAPGFGFTDYTSYAILLSGIAIYGVWGMWYIYSRRKQLISG